MQSLVIPCDNEANVLGLTYGVLVEATAAWRELAGLVLTLSLAVLRCRGGWRPSRRTVP